ncbi:hypothetical protein VTN00DRAFT_10172 [Thermoascus crustaceus]|uniref:uncharacterized protein n=1 Tax=Thermoascus crustaceus TaxID=5088 RepID=UPI003744A284
MTAAGQLPTWFASTDTLVAGAAGETWDPQRNIDGTFTTLEKANNRTLERRGIYVLGQTPPATNLRPVLARPNHPSIDAA